MTSRLNWQTTRLTWPIRSTEPKSNAQLVETSVSVNNTEFYSGLHSHGSRSYSTYLWNNKKNAKNKIIIIIIRNK